jgi:hypothetical protein
VLRRRAGDVVMHTTFSFKAKVDWTKHCRLDRQPAQGTARFHSRDALSELLCFGMQGFPQLSQAVVQELTHRSTDNISETSL